MTLLARIQRRRALGKPISPEYQAWTGMIQRCTNPRRTSFARYGGRGIRVAAAWRGPGGFAAFFLHVGPRPSAAHSLDRIDNDGDYEPGNVRWALPGLQKRNSRPIRLLTLDGETMCLQDWAARFGVSYWSLRWHVDRGLSLSAARECAKPASRARRDR